MPNNWVHVPLIRLILPRARIIDARRHPLGCCFSNFKQHFARGQGFSYDLADMGRYYRDYVRLMAHIDRVLPGHVHRVIYERMVDDTEAEVRALLAACGLPFEEACLAFTKPRAPCGRPVRSRCASRSIVTAPRHGSRSSRFWRRCGMRWGMFSRVIRKCRHRCNLATVGNER
jgi:hypothetical protein